MEHQDLDDLAGSWTRHEAEAFDRAVKAQRQIDEDRIGGEDAAGPAGETPARRAQQ